MQVVKLRSGLFLVFVTVLVLAACGGSDDTKSEPTVPPATQASAPTTQAAPTEPSTEGQGESPATVAPSEPTQGPEEPGIPFDVPIMEGAVDLEIQEKTGTVTYQVQSATIEDVIEYYENEMPEHGWKEVSASEVGLMATLVFESDEARMSISLQANNIAEIVNIRLIILNK